MPRQIIDALRRELWYDLPIPRDIDRAEVRAGGRIKIVKRVGEKMWVEEHGSDANDRFTFDAWRPIKNNDIENPVDGENDATNGTDRCTPSV